MSNKICESKINVNVALEVIDLIINSREMEKHIRTPFYPVLCGLQGQLKEVCLEDKDHKPLNLFELFEGEANKEQTQSTIQHRCKMSLKKMKDLYNKSTISTLISSPVAEKQAQKRGSHQLRFLIIYIETLKGSNLLKM